MEIELDFRESIVSDTEGKVQLRIQYIHDPVKLITDTLVSLARSEELILQLLKEIDLIYQKPDLQTSITRKDTFYDGGQYYYSNEESKKNSEYSSRKQTISEELKDMDSFQYDRYFDSNFSSHRPSIFMVNQIIKEKERRRTTLLSCDNENQDINQTQTYLLPKFGVEE